MLTCHHIPGAWSASELNLVPVVPPMAFCGASAEDELVLELATQPVSLSCVVAAEAAERNAGTASTMPQTVSAATISRNARRAARCVPRRAACRVTSDGDAGVIGLLELI